MTKISQWIRSLVDTKQRCFYTFQMDGVDLLRQLQFEEFLYRKVAPLADRCVFFLINNHRRTGTEAVVMGLSGKESDFVKDPEGTRSRGIKIIKRFTGGGTVIVDKCSINTSVIASTQLANKLSPMQICSWSYENVFKNCGLFNERFTIVEGDFVVKDSISEDSVNTAVTLDGQAPAKTYYKVAGNSQAYNDKAFVHHSVFLWDISPLISQILLHPKKTPTYRGGRDHMCFLRSVREALDIRMGLTTIDGFEQALCDRVGRSLLGQTNRNVHVKVSVNQQHDGDIRDALNSDEISLSDSFLDEAISKIGSPLTSLV